MVLPGGPHYPEVMADIFDVIADGTRRELLQCSSSVRLGGLGERRDQRRPDRRALGISQPTVSKHLKVLREHGLVTVREEGQHRYYRLDTEPLEEVEDWLMPFLSADFDGDARG